MPVYRSDVNSYTVKGVAVDRKGNRQNQAETQVTVQAPSGQCGAEYLHASLLLAGCGQQ